jgi:hypothetical protein
MSHVREYAENTVLEDGQDGPVSFIDLFMVTSYAFMSTSLDPFS